ncbi:hypothetical protein IPP75_00280 [Candidatus Saccharibacteria bacterium]|nr:MAG: hypothetical protein IPP75_00280 [Candidatus Saccharibacteria bacterium]
MAWRRKKSNESLSSPSKTGSEEDAKTANLQAAFAKIKYPPPVVSMVGAVVHADGKVEGRHPISSPASPQNASPIPQTPVPAATTVAKTPAPENPPNETVPTPPTPAQVKVAPEAENPVALATQTASAPTSKTHEGPLSKKELTALGEFLKQKKKAPAPKTVATPVIAPTNPDPEAAIASHIAQKKKAEEADAAAIEAEKWHVSQAKINEKTLDSKELYRLIALWLAAI